MIIYAVYDIAKLFWLRLLAISMIGAIFAITQTLLALIFLSRFTQSAQSLPFFDLGAVTQSLTPLAFGAVIFALGTFSAVFIFLSRIISISMMTDYEKHCVDKVLVRLESNKAKVKTMAPKNLLVLLSKDCRFGGRIANEVSSLMLPISVNLIGIPILFYLDASATILLLTVILLTGYLQFMASKIARKVGFDLETAGYKDSAEKADFNKQFQAWLSGKAADMKRHDFSMPHPDFVKSYRRRLAMPSLGQFIGTIGFTIAIAVLGIDFLREGRAFDGAKIALYIYVSFFALSQLRTVSKAYINSHVFFAFFQRAFTVMNDDFSLLSQTPNKLKKNLTNDEMDI